VTVSRVRQTLSDFDLPGAHCSWFSSGGRLLVLPPDRTPRSDERCSRGTSPRELLHERRGAIIRSAREMSRLRDFFRGKYGSSRGLD
jgi:hypothetical protein